MYKPKQDTPKQLQLLKQNKQENKSAEALLQDQKDSLVDGGIYN